MFVTNWISTTKIQKISEITNFFRHYFLSRTEVDYGNNGRREQDDASQQAEIYVAVNLHFLYKHKVEFRELLNWAKYIRKKIKAGTLPGEQRLLFEALEASWSNEHTGGRWKCE